MIDWKSLNHEMPEGWEKYVVLLCEAGSADNELKLLIRFQKVIRLIHDEQAASLRLSTERNNELARKYEQVLIAIRDAPWVTSNPDIPPNFGNFARWAKEKAKAALAEYEEGNK